MRKDIHIENDNMFAASKNRHNNKCLVAGTDRDGGYQAHAAGYQEPQGCKVPGNDIPFVK